MYALERRTRIPDRRCFVGVTARASEDHAGSGRGARLTIGLLPAVPRIFGFRTRPRFELWAPRCRARWCPDRSDAACRRVPRRRGQRCGSRRRPSACERRRDPCPGGTDPNHRSPRVAVAPSGRRLVRCAKGAKERIEAKRYASWPSRLESADVARSACVGRPSDVVCPHRVIENGKRNECAIPTKCFAEADHVGADVLLRGVMLVVCKRARVAYPLPALPRQRAEWAGAELNRRHADFQSAALPTELPARASVGCGTLRVSRGGGP